MHLHRSEQQTQSQPLRLKLSAIRANLGVRQAKNDRAAAKTGIVATAVKTTVADVSTIPSVKVIEFMLKAIITIKPQLKRLRHSNDGFCEKNSLHPNIKTAPIKMPRQKRRGHLSSSDSRITRVSRVRTSMPKRAINTPKSDGFVSRIFRKKVSIRNQCCPQI